MKLKTSFCNPIILKKNISRFAVIWGIFAGVLFMSYSLTLLNAKTLYNDFDYHSLVNTYASVSTVAGIFHNQIFAVVSAAACFAYLHRARSAYMMHAFPVTRDGLFSTNLISGALFGLVPQIAIMLVNMLITVQIPGAAAVLLRCLGGWLLQYLFFYGLAVLCMVLTGKTVFGILLYLVFNYIAPVLESVVRSICAPLLFGIVDSSIGTYKTLALSPVVYLLSELLEDMTDFLSEGGSTAATSVWGYLVAIGGTGLVMMAAAWLLYRVRQMENAGEVIAYRKLKPIFKYGFTVCVSLCLGIILTAICGSEYFENGNGFMLLICLLVSGFIGYFLAEMMLGKTMRVFKKKAFIGFGIFAAVVVVLVAVVQLDVLNVVHRVPAAENVSSVEVISDVYYWGGEQTTVSFDTPEKIGEVIEIHQQILDCHDGKGNNSGDSVCITLKYRLKNGGTVTRTYDCFYGSDTSMDALFDGTEVLQSYYDIEAMQQSGGAEIADAPYWNEQSYLSAAEMEQVIACLQEDIAANRIDFYYDVFCDHAGFTLRLSDRSYVVIPHSAEAAYACLQTLIPNITEADVSYE